jgi:hypothetical protein
MRKLLITILSVCIGLTGSVTLASAGLFSGTGPVIAIMADDLFVGEAEGHLSGAGTLLIHSQTSPELTCTGQFTSSAVLGGSGRLHCSDGTSMIFQFQRLSVLRGYGIGNGSRGAEAGPYLKLPEGKKLTTFATELRLVDR